MLLTPGFAPFDARRKGEYGYGVYDNVLSAVEFERMVSLAGSSGARLLRRLWRWRPAAGTSDGGAPRRVGFVHCVGSRDPLCGAGHCSSACCMYTAKQVALAKEIEPDLEVTVYHMDLRAFGKGFEAYLEGVQALPGVTYRRAMPSSVHQRPADRGAGGDLRRRRRQPGEEAFDLLVLAIGFAPPAGMQALARSLGVELNEYGFAVTDGYRPARTGREGVFVAGAFREPKDIPETVVEAAGAAAEVAAFLERRGRAHPLHGDKPRHEQALRDVADEEPRGGGVRLRLRPRRSIGTQWGDERPRPGRADRLGGGAARGGPGPGGAPGLHGGGPGGHPGGDRGGGAEPGGGRRLLAAAVRRRVRGADARGGARPAVAGAGEPAGAGGLPPHRKRGWPPKAVGDEPDRQSLLAGGDGGGRLASHVRA